MPSYVLDINIEKIINYGGLLATLFAFCFSFALLIIGLNILAIQKEAVAARDLVEKYGEELRSKRAFFEALISMNTASSEAAIETLLVLQSSDLFMNEKSPRDPGGMENLDLSQNYILWENLGHLRQIMLAIKPGLLKERVSALREVIGGIEANSADSQQAKILEIARNVAENIIVEMESISKGARTRQHNQLMYMLGGLINQSFAVPLRNEE